MKIMKKVLAVIICLTMFMTSMLNEGLASMLLSIKASAMAGHEQNYDDPRVELDFNKDWLFSLSDDGASYMKGYDDSDWEEGKSLLTGFSESIWLSHGPKIQV